MKMQAVMVVYDQVLAEELLDSLDEMGIRGFTRWNDIQGRGSETGNPHMGTHTWPALNGALLCVLPEEQTPPLLAALRELNDKAEEHGLRAFVWPVEVAV